MSKPQYPRAEFDHPSSFRGGPARRSGAPQQASSAHANERLFKGPVSYRFNPQDRTQRNPGQSRFRAWIQRNPKTFHVVGVTTGLLIFFSRPLYDIFLREHFEGPLPVRPNPWMKTEEKK